MNSIIYSYAKMINDGICTIENIPESYRNDVQQYLANGDTDNNSSITDDTPAIHGALYLQPINETVDTSILGYGGSLSIYYDNSTIFNEDVLGSNPMPNNIEYAVVRVENVYGKFQGEPVIEVNSTTGLNIKLTGTPRNITPDSTILRIDLKIISSNYEDMRITIYLNAQ